MQRALAICVAVGDLGFAAYAYRGLLSMDLFCGAPLSHICFLAEEALAFAQASGLWISVDVLILQRHLALGLMGRDEEQSFEVPNIIEPHPSEGTQPLNAFLRYVAQIQLNVLAGRHDIALALAELADKISWRFKAYSEFTEYRFYTGLAHAAAYGVSPPEAREKHLDYLREQHRKFTNWSARVPGNFIARKSLLASEIARIEGRELEAQRLYEEAIQSAREAGFVQIEAIAAERAAWFYEARGIRTVVLSYLAHARDCYLRWGAEAKVRQLNDMHPQLREKDSALNFTHTIGAPFEQLDLATVLKVSEAVSGEMVLEKLTDTLLRTAIEHAGAERGVLILPQRTELRVRAEAKASGSSTTVNLLDLPISDADIPESVILYTARMRESVILDDALAPGYFAGDEYLHRKQARSVLCLPLIKQGKTVALLYLENNLAPRAFTPARVTVLRFLVSEAATSLDNARLYRELQERESRIRRLVEANIIGIFIFGPGYEIVEANDSFLNIVGYGREDLEAGRLHWTKLTPPEGHDRTLRAHTELRTSGAVQPFIREYVRKDGSRVPVLVGVASFEQHDQGVGFVLDLSEQQRAEAEARESEQRYRVAQMELAHANRVAVMGHLTASIAHEVNQPNTAVVASAQAAMRWLDRRPPDVEKARQALARVEQNAMRASEVIGRIRNLIKKTPPRKDCLAINPVIREVIELTHAETTKNGILVRTEFAEHLPNVVGDRVELQQVAVNLILNAIEAMTGMTKGARELLIRTAKTDDEGVLVAVMDSGPGLSATTLDRLFEPFYTTKASGMGVGLSICRSIIEGHGGRLWASANVPHGATFQFVLPTSGHASANLIASARPSRLLG